MLHQNEEEWGVRQRYEVRQLEEWELRLHEELLLNHIDQQRWFAVILHPDFPEELIIPIQ
jgi:hypothetical protein